VKTNDLGGCAKGNKKGGGWDQKKTPRYLTPHQQLILGEKKKERGTALASTEKKIQKEPGVAGKNGQLCLSRPCEKSSKENGEKRARKKEKNAS